MAVEFKGLQELIKDLDKVDVGAEKKLRSHLNRQGREFIDAAKENTPRGTKGGRKIVDSYVSMQVRRNFKDFEKPIRNKAPHHHLVNNGHRLVKNGKVIGYVGGRRYIEKTISDKQDEFHEQTEEFLGDLFKELL